MSAANVSLAGDVDSGKIVYLEHGCYSCHGYNGIGRHSLADGSSGILTSEALFVNYLRLRADQNPMLPANSMPNYSVEVLSDESAKDVYAYIMTMKDDSPEVDDNPVLKEILQSAQERTNDDLEN